MKSLKYLSLCVLVCFGVFTTSCSHVSPKSANPLKTNKESEISYIQRPEVKNLSLNEANYRSSLISHLTYDLQIALDSELPAFKGTVKIGFLLSTKSDLTLDFDDGTVEQIWVNGKQIQAPYNKIFLTLPAAELQLGKNELKIAYSHLYSASGAGLYRFKDPEDLKTYVYTDFEPYSANKFLPCFDQPDLKAIFKISVSAPKEWSVISAGSVEHEKTLGEDKNWDFKAVGPLSTYLISLHAGPYKVWTSKSGNIPIRLFARQSLSKYVVSEDWLYITKKGLAFYQKFFDTPYPFEKYDEVIVPDFNEGAMENAAAVTFSERYVQKGKPTLEERETLASTILHEMAHMWFGDLVTMKWWNDLWLNESFATFVAGISVGEATPYKRSWFSFFTGEKQWAYWQDQSVITHPVESIAKDTDDAFSNFDGITYGKGASVLKQLSFYIGNKSFQNGIRDYFKKFAYKNAALNDFMSALQRHTSQNLGHWTSEWLKTSGVNTVESQFKCSDGKITSYNLLQIEDEESHILRTHRTLIGFFDRDMYGTIKFRKSFPLTYSKSINEVKELVGEKCPVLVQPNYQDYDYVSVKLDPISLNTAKNEISHIADPFSRMMIWKNIWEMTRLGRFSLNEFSLLVFNQLANESDFKILDSMLTDITGKGERTSLIRLFHFNEPSAVKREADFRIKLENFLFQMFSKSEAGSDKQKRVFDSYAQTLVSAEGRQRLKNLLSGKETVAGFELDQDRRWASLYRLASLGDENIDDLLKSEHAKDTSGEGQKSFLAAQASRPGLDNKQIWFDKLLNDKSLSLSQSKSIMRGMFPSEQLTLRSDLREKFWSYADEVAKNRESEFQKDYSESLAPVSCKEESVTAAKLKLAGSLKLTAVMLRNLKVAVQESGRCVTVLRP
jgi:aminopeptidase N